MPIYMLNGKQPLLDASAYLAPGAVVIGNVRIGAQSSVWFNCVLRGDAEAIVIGERTNVQDLTMCHADPGKPLYIGDRVTIGHRCVVHGCTIEDDCLIGMGAVVMNGARIGTGSIVAAGSVVLEEVQIPPLSLVTGIPGKVKRQLDASAQATPQLPVDIYAKRAVLYASPDKFVQIDD